MWCSLFLCVAAMYSFIIEAKHLYGFFVKLKELKEKIN